MLKVAASLEQINQFTLTWIHRSSFRRFWPTHKYSPLLLSQKSPWSTSCPPHPVLAPWSPDKWAMSSVSYPRHWERCNILNCTGLQRWPVVSCVVKTSVWKQRKQYLLWDKPTELTKTWNTLFYTDVTWPAHILAMTASLMLTSQTMHLIPDTSLNFTYVMKCLFFLATQNRFQPHSTSVILNRIFDSLKSLACVSLASGTLQLTSRSMQTASGCGCCHFPLRPHPERHESHWKSSN